MVKISIKGLTFSYRSAPTLKGVTLEVHEGEVLSLVGPNGAGKTTLLKCINGILKPRIGVIMLDERNLNEYDGRELGKKLGYVPQAEYSHFPLTVFDAVLMGRRPYLRWWRPSKKDLEKVVEALKLVGIEHIAMRYVNELSGGQRQAVLIARALAQDPEVLLLDEPTSNLDVKHQIMIMELIRKLTRDRRVTVVMAIHDLNLAARYSDKMVMLKDGTIYAQGNPHEVLTPENVLAVYGVKASILIHNDKLLVVPEEAIA